MKALWALLAGAAVGCVGGIVLGGLSSRSAEQLFQQEREAMLAEVVRIHARHDSGRLGEVVGEFQEAFVDESGRGDLVELETYLLAYLSAQRQSHAGAEKFLSRAKDACKRLGREDCQQLASRAAEICSNVER